MMSLRKSCNKAGMAKTRNTTMRTMVGRPVNLQLDYFMSTQFAGVAVAESKGFYRTMNIDCRLLPTVDVGLEAASVRQHYDAKACKELVLGTCEQNILIPVFRQDATLKLKAVAAMFGRTPLCIAAKAGSFGKSTPLRIGAHEDTIALFQILIPNATMIKVEREDKLQMLMDGHIDAVQVYDVMEVLTLREKFGDTVIDVRACDSFGKDTDLGYSQVLFTPEEALQNPAQRLLLKDFLTATFAGWKEAIKNTKEAAISVRKAVKKQFLLDGHQQPDHWLDTEEFYQQSIARCNDYVKLTAGSGDTLGIIDRESWKHASHWLLHHLSTPISEAIPLPATGQGLGPAAPGQGLGPTAPGQRLDPKSSAEDHFIDTTLDTTLWGLNPKLMSGHALCHTLRRHTKTIAAEVLTLRGKPPSLTVITVGDVAVGHTHPTADRRFELFGSTHASWFSKTSSGASLGIDVNEINLPATVTTEEIVTIIRSLQHPKTAVDGIQLMWPLPDHLDSVQLYQSIPVHQDVDGAHYMAQMELRGGHQAAKASIPTTTPTTTPTTPTSMTSTLPHPPVTPQAVLSLLAHHHVNIAGKRVLVLGRSRIVGQPLAYMLTTKNALVTIAHSDTPLDVLAEAVQEADIVIPCTGSPGLLQPAWIKPGAVVVNVGTTFLHDTLQGDIASEQSFLSRVSLLASCPGGIGPLSLALLLQATADQALLNCQTNFLTLTTNKPRPKGANKSTKAIGTTDWDDFTIAHSHWSKHEINNPKHGIITHITTDFLMNNYVDAIAFLGEITVVAEEMNHHPNLSIEHHCTEGATVKVELFTLSTLKVTHLDLSLASSIDMLYQTHAKTPSYTKINQQP